MRYLNSLIKLGCFSYEEANKLTGSDKKTASMLLYHSKNGSISQIRRGLYTAISPIDDEPLAERYQIGSKISKTAVISHHSAFEYHGCASQVSYRITISSKTRFNSFKFNGYSYERSSPNIDSGILLTENGERITDLERTVLDSINDFENDMGFEELIHCLELVSSLDEEKLLSYLKLYNKQFLYQKSGFILTKLKENLSLSENFFVECKKFSHTSSRYLLKNMKGEELAFDNQWKITYPKNLWANVLGDGVGDI